jgi:COP9 signalosome complex subunit 3
LILLQLLKDGKTSPLPRYTSQAVTRAIRSKLAGVEAYQNIAKAYEAEPSIRLYAADNEKMRRQAYSVQDNLEVEINKGMDTLSKDQNVGLVKRLLGIFVRRRIQRLSRLINRLKVGDIVDLLGGEIEGKTGNEACLGVIAALEQMDADRWLRLTVEEGTGGQGSPAEVIVRFAQHEVDHAGLEAVHRLTRIMQEASWWDKVVEYKQKSVKTSEAYLSKVGILLQMIYSSPC